MIRSFLLIVNWSVGKCTVKKTSRIVENTLISYLIGNISALKNGERFEVLQKHRYQLL